MNILLVFVGFIIGILLTSFLSKKIYVLKMNEILERSKDVEEKWSEFYLVLNEWLEIKNKGYSLVEYFNRKSIRSVAVYGAKELGIHLIDELIGTEITVAYVIDKNLDREKYIKNIMILSPEEDLPDIDAIVVTAIHYYADIEEVLSRKTNVPIINLQDLIYEILNNQ